MFQIARTHTDSAVFNFDIKTKVVILPGMDFDPNLDPAVWRKFDRVAQQIQEYLLDTYRVAD